MKRSVGIIIMGLVLLLAGLPGCISRDPIVNQSTSTQVHEELPAKLPAAASAPSVDPVKAAEAEQWLDQGLQFYEQGQYKAAVNAFDNAITSDPSNYKVYTAKGITLAFQGSYPAGIALIEKTLELKPDYVPAYYDMAMAYKLQKKYDESLIWFKKTIQGDPSNTWSYYGIATIYADRGNNADSLIYLKQAIELDPGVKAIARQQSHFDKMRSLPEFQALVK
ncbi:MAG: tetratricopeptide repeat protein [Firmicutes bacterium]|nr:tetratricopeptide repeat protein [Bacillota bacterium]